MIGTDGLVGTDVLGTLKEVQALLQLAIEEIKQARQALATREQQSAKLLSAAGYLAAIENWFGGGKLTFIVMALKNVAQRMDGSS